MIAIIVATPLQLFNCMMIMRHHFKGEKCDLFVLNIACDMHHYVEKYMQADIIEEVFYVDRFFHNQSKLGKFLSMFYASNHQKKILKKVYLKTYNHLFTTWVGVSSSWLYTRLIKKNPQMHLHFYEEGIGVYLNSIFIRNKIVKMFYRSFGNRLDEDYIEDLYAYKPNLCKDVKSSLKCIPIGDLDDSDNAFLQHVNDGVCINPYNNKVLYLESNYQDYSNKRDIDELSIIQNISYIIGNDNLTIRTHPRTDYHFYVEKGFNVDKNVNTNWELILSRNVQLNETTLVTISSTAVFTPNIIFRYEPKLIIIGKCIRNENPELHSANFIWTKSLEQLCEKLVSSYKDKSRILIPESYSELTNLLLAL